MLPGHPEQRPARDQELDQRSSQEDAGHQIRRGQEVLEVVEHQQRIRGGQAREQHLPQWKSADLTDLQRGRDRVDNALRIGKTREGNEDDAIGELGGEIIRNRDRHPGFADAARTGQGEQPDLAAAQERHGEFHLVLAPDKWRQGNWQPDARSCRRPWLGLGSETWRSRHRSACSAMWLTYSG